MSKQINQSIVIDAKVKTTLEGMNEVVSKLNQGLREGTAKLDLTKGVGSSLSKQMDKFKDEYSKFSKYIEGGKIEFADVKDAIKSGETLIKTFKEMRRIIGDFDDLTVIDAKKLFPDAFDSRVSDLLKGLSGLSSAMTKLESKQLDLATAKTEMGELAREAQRLQGLIDQEVALKLKLDQAQSDLKHFDLEIEAIRAKAAKGITLKINTAEAAHAEAQKGIEEIETARKTRGFSQEDFSGTTARAVKFKGKTEKQWTDESTKKDASEASKAEAAAALKAIRIYRQEENALKDLNAMLQARKKEIDSLREGLSNINNMKVSQAVKIAGGTAEEINEANAAMQVQAEATAEAAAAQGKYNAAVQQAKGASDKIEKTNTALEAQQAKIDKITLEIGELNREVSTEALAKAFSAAGVEGFSASMLKSKEGIEELRKKLNQLDEERLTGLKKALGDIGLGADKTEDYVEQLRGTLGGVRESADDIKRTASEMDNLKNQVLQFFSLTNAVQLFRRAVASALNTVKELDETMTEAAVVTDFSVDDMWEKLPEYSANAQKLGVSINGMYQATTLYYQQGLKTNEAMQLGIETMKMAKIAGIDSTEATKAMTAALRGFNMELNETSAIKVNDVYSQLAAVTAADTNQIATAMEKTASIAASANMEFETTAALLAQIIETTQEAPETAGTALKTIIARFSEVKALKQSGKTSGEDVEGEIIDVNKIQTALRTVGISMEGFFNGTEGLDSILLKLSEKWGTLDFETQRYIATMAAGSRQQSRFIAMMSDYGRTTQLVGEAQNSTGASQKQFEKTQESLATSIQKLKNAWNEFLMGLANNEVLKFAVDSLTFIVETINKITDAISGGNGLTKSLVSLMGVIGALKLGKGILSGTGVTNILGNLTGGATTMKETVTETAGADGTTVRTIVREPVKEGRTAGSQAGQGFIAGFRGTITKDKTGAKSVKGFLKKNASQAGTVTANSLDEDAFKNHLAQAELGLNPDDLSERAMGIRKINEQLADGEITTNQAAEAYKKLGGSVDQFSVKTEQTAEKANQLSINMQSVGTAAIGIGAALGLLSTLFEKAGLEEWAEPISTLAGVFMGLGGAIKTLTTLFPALGQVAIVEGGKIAIAGYTTQLAWWWVLLIVAAVAALIILIVKLAQAAKKNSIENRMKEAAKATEEAKQAAQDAKDAYEDLLSDKSEYDTLQDKLRTLTKGTLEWKQAIADANTQVLEMLETYPELAKYIERGDGGSLSISDEGWDQLIEKQLQGVKNAQTGIIQAELNEVRLQEENARAAYQYAGEMNGFYDIADEHKNSNDTAALNGIYDAFVADFNDDKNLFAKNENGNYSSELIALAGSFGYTAEQIASLEESLSKSLSLEKGMLEDDYHESAAREYAIGVLADTARQVGIKAVDDASGNYLEVDTQALERIYTAYVEDPAMFLAESSAEASDKLHILAGEVGQSSSQLLNMKNSLATYHKSMMDIEAKKRGYAISSLTAMASEEMLADSLGEGLIEGLAGGYEAQTKAQADAIQGALHNKTKGSKASATSSNKEFTALASKYGVDSSQLTNDETTNLKKVYAAMTNVSEDSITDDAATLAKKIAEIEAGNKYGEKVNQIYDKFKTLSKNDQKTYATAISKDYTKANRQDLKNLAAMDSADYEQMAKKLGYADAQTFATEMLGYQDIVNANGEVVSSAFAQMVEDMKKTAEYGMVEFEVIKEQAAQSGINIDKNYLYSATAEQLQNYTDLMNEALAKGGTKGLQDFSASFDEIMRYASEEQKAMILGSLDSFDFSQEGEAQQFFAFLESIGMYLPYDAVNDFTNKLKDLQDGFRLISLSALREEIKEYLDLADQLEGRNDSEGLTDEERQQMLDAGLATEDDFAWNGQTWLYLEGPMADLASAIRENTGALLQKTKEELEEQVERGHQVEQFVGKNIGGYLQQTVYDPEGDVHYLAYTVQDLLEEKINDPAFLRQLFGLSGDMTDAEVMQYYKDSLVAYDQLAANENSLLKMENRSNFLVDTNNVNPMLMQGTETYEQVTTYDGESYRLFGNMQAQRQMQKIIEDNGGEMTSSVVKGGPTQEQQTQIKALAKQYGVSQATIDDFTEAMKTSNVEQRNAATTAIKNAIEQKIQEKQYGKTLKKLSAVGEEYGTVTEGMLGYDEAIRAYATALGTNDYGFVAENMELIQEAAQGNIDSILELNRLLAQEHGLTITADGNFDLYNSKVDMANEATQNFLKSQYEAKSMRLVEITVDQKQEYIVPDGNGGFKLESFDVGQTIQVLQPVDAPSIQRSIESSGSSSTKSEPVDNPYDKYFNDLEKINDLLRERERLERAYQRLVRKGLRNVNDVRKSQQEQLASIREENDMQRVMIANRTGQIQESIQKSKVSKYVQIETNQYGDQSPRIDWDEIDKVYKSGNEKEIEKIEKFLDENQGWLEDIYERESIIEENLDKEYELLQDGKEDYMSIEEQIKSAIETNAQKEIDKLSAVNDSINDTNSKLLESMQQQLDEYRQNRSNAKTQEELSDKQRRLAYLQQDTSGANALEIMQLQKELEQGQEDYTDTLIDQKINELQKQNDEAATQRQEQIDILNAQLRHYIDSGEVWGKVNELLTNAIDSDGNIKMDSELMRVLKEANGYEALSEIGKLDWYKDLLSTIANGFNWLKGDGLLASFWEGQKISFTTADGEKPITGTVNADGTVTSEDGQVYSNVRWNGGNNFSTTETTKKNEPTEEPETPVLTEEIKKGVSKAIWSGSQGWGNGQERKNKLKEVFGENDIQKNYVDKKIYSGKASDYSYEKMRLKFRGFKTGGLADFTGPAWLDGTKSKPEYILNAEQTKAFFSLVDVLSSLQTNGSKASQNTGDNTYDIDINVESIGSDYDVEQLAIVVKRLINEDARYRNNNAINLMR